MNSDATKSISSKWSAKQMAMIGLMAAVICILGPLSISIPVSPVPISLGLLGVAFAVYMLGMKKGTLSVLIYLLLGLVGLPVFSSLLRRYWKAVWPHRRLSDRIHPYGIDRRLLRGKMDV